MRVVLAVLFCLAGGVSAFAATPFYIVLDQPGIREGDGPAVFHVRRNDASTAASVNYYVEAKQDGITSWGSLSFAIGETNKDVVVPIVDDDIYTAPTYGCELVLTDHVHNPLISAVLIVEEDDPPVSYEFGPHPPVYYENQGDITIPLKRIGQTSQPATVKVQRWLGSFYSEQFVTFAAGSDSAAVVYPRTNDSYYGGPPNEWRILLWTPTNRLADQSEFTTIDDEPIPHLTVQRAQVVESDVDYAVPITLTIEPAYAYDVTYHFKAEGQSAGEHDFQPGFIPVTWQATQKTATLLLPLEGDDVPENDETLLLTTPNQSLQGNITVEILDDDRPPFAFAFDATDYTFDENIGGDVKITRTGTLPAATVTMFFLGRTTVEWPDPVTLEFAAGETMKVVPIHVDDPWYTGRREASLALEWGGFRGETADLTIHDDETRPTVTIADTTVLEGAAGETTHAEFELTLSGAIGTSLVIGVSTEHGTARGDDYMPLISSAVFPAGSLSTRVTVGVRGDAAQEADETFALRITSCCDGLAEIVRDKAFGTIRNDDGGVSTAFGLEVAARVEERQDWLQAIVTRGDATTDVTATVKVSAGAARPLAPQSVRFRVGEKRKTVRWFIDDRVHSGDAYATVDVYAGERRDQTAAVQIVDDERAPVITVYDTTVTRIDGTPGPRMNAKFLITIEPPVWTDVQLQISTYTQGSQYSGWAGPGEFEQINRIIDIPAATSRFELPVWVQSGAANAQPSKAFLLRMNFLGPVGIVPSVPRTEARCEFVPGPAIAAFVGEYDPLVPVGGKQKVTVELPLPAITADAVLLESSDASILSVPPSVNLVPGSKQVSFDATGVARGEASVKIALPLFYQAAQLTAALEVFTVHVPSVSPGYLILRPGETVRVALAAMPVALDTLRATIEAKDKSIAFTHPDAQVHAGLVGSFDVYGANVGKTEIVVRFEDAGATEVRVPVEVTDADARKRGVRH